MEDGSPTHAVCTPNATGPHPGGQGAGLLGGNPGVLLTQNPFSRIWPAEQKIELVCCATAGMLKTQAAMIQTTKPDPAKLMNFLNLPHITVSPHKFRQVCSDEY